MRRITLVSMVSLVASALLMPMSGCEWPFAAEPEQAVVEDAEPPPTPEVRGEIALGDVANDPPFVGDPGVDRFGYPIEQVDEIALLTLVRLRRFDDLDRFFEFYQTSFEADFHRENWPVGAMDAFGVSDPEIGERLDEWVATKPNSYAAHAARGSYHFDLGRTLRGGGYVKDTSAARLEGMAKELELAVPDLEAALKLRPTLVAARLQLLQIANFRGDDASERTQLEAALETCPDCYLPHRLYLHARTPRWGGSYPEMQAYIASLAPKAVPGAGGAARPLADANPKLALLAGQPDLDRCDLAALARDWKAGHEACDAGLRHGDEVNLLNAKGRLFYGQEQYASALPLLDRALAIQPQLQVALERRFFARYATNDFLGAGRDVLTLRQLDPTDDYAANNVKSIVDKLISEGDARSAAGDYLGAADYYALGLQLAPSYQELVTRRGTNQRHLGFDNIEAQLAAAPDDFGLRQSIDYGLAGLGRYTEILPMWDAYIQTHPGDPRAYLERGGTKWMLDNREAALLDFNKACALGMTRACGDAERASARLHRAPPPVEDKSPLERWGPWIGLPLLAGLLGLLVYLRRTRS